MTRFDAEPDVPKQVQISAPTPDLVRWVRVNAQRDRGSSISLMHVGAPHDQIDGLLIEVLAMMGVEAKNVGMLIMSTQIALGDPWVKVTSRPGQIPEFVQDLFEALPVSHEGNIVEGLRDYSFDFWPGSGGTRCRVALSVNVMRNGRQENVVRVELPDIDIRTCSDEVLRQHFNDYLDGVEDVLDALYLLQNDWAERHDEYRIPRPPRGTFRFEIS